MVFSDPWNLNEVTALDTNSDSYIAQGLAAYDSLIPPKACVGAVLGPRRGLLPALRDKLTHKVIYMSPYNDFDVALRDGLFYVVLDNGAEAWAADAFQSSRLAGHAAPVRLAARQRTRLPRQRRVPATDRLGRPPAARSARRGAVAA